MAEAPTPDPVTKQPSARGSLPKTVVNSIGMKLVLVPDGRFTMGAPKSEKHRRYAEGPEHPVHITRPFYMGIYEVTQGEFEKVMGVNPSYHTKVEGQDTRRFPADNVNFVDAKAFCQKLSDSDAEKQNGRKYRLPTEAEWEYACRAGSSTAFSHGPGIASRDANFNGWHPYAGGERGPYLERTTTVGSYKPNEFGLYDMHGNVYEWVSDWFGDKYYAASPPEDPQGPKEGKYRVLRGGSWQNVGSMLRAAERYYDREVARHEDHGLRVVMETP